MRQLRRNQKGETLIGVIAGLLIVSIALTATVSGFMGFSRGSIDHRIIGEANDAARMISDIMGYEIRMMGAGMPIWQGNFQMTDAALGTAPLPILTTSTASSITFRLNEKGRNTILTGSFDPSSTNTFSVVSTADFQVGDTVYLSDATTTGQYGLQGTVSVKGANSLTLAAGMVYTAGATFPSGSTADPIKTVTYTSTGGAVGITRTVDATTSTLAPFATFSLQYLNSDGTVLALPLTAAVIDSSLYAIQLSVSVTNDTRLASGNFYTATLTNRYGLRNLNVGR